MSAVVGGVNEPNTSCQEGAFLSDALYQSEDAGTSWQKAASLADMGRVYGVHAHPADGKTVYIAAEKVFF